MSKAKKILLSVIAVLGFFGILGVAKAAELKSTFVDNLCVGKDGAKLVIKYDLLRDIDLSGDDPVSYMYASIYDLQEDGSQVGYGNACYDGVCENKGIFEVSNNTTCGDFDIKGNSAYSKPLKKGMSLATYYEMHNKDFTTADNLFVEVAVRGNDYQYEIIVYSLKEKKIVSIDNGRDTLAEINNEVINHYSDSITEHFVYGYTDETGKDYILGYFKDVSDNYSFMKTIKVENYETKSMEDIFKEIDAQLEGKEYEYYLSEGETLDKDVFKAIKDNGYYVTMPMYYYSDEYDEEPTLLYSWIFDGSKMTSSDFDINMDITSGSTSDAVKALIPGEKKNPLSVVFKYHGNLPEGTKVKYNVSETYENGKKLTLYYYNEEAKKVEEVQKGLEVVDGFVTLDLEHCSEYVLVEENESNNVQTSSLNVTFYGFVSAVSAGLIFALIKSKKRV